MMTSRSMGLRPFSLWAKTLTAKYMLLSLCYKSDINILCNKWNTVLSRSTAYICNNGQRPVNNKFDSCQVLLAHFQINQNTQGRQPKLSREKINQCLINGLWNSAFLLAENCLQFPVKVQFWKHALKILVIIEKSLWEVVH